jgi:hypothetical protein
VLAENSIRQEALERQRMWRVGSPGVDAPQGPPRDDQVAVQDAARTRAREPCASAAGGGAHPDGWEPTATLRGVGPSLLGSPLAGMGGMEGGPGDRGAGHGDPLAPGGVQALLEAKEPVQTGGTPGTGTGGREPDPEDVAGQRDLVSVSSHKGPALAVFASLMGPPSSQAHGTTPRRWGDPDFSGSWGHALFRLMGPPVSLAA